ncbi:YtxH domain-containing protein [Cohnella endophytica]|uniref:YtxH domain-containing protein n=1 Tax=Cohnella endophytica TaxID=2419778 RepID=A0A494X688_9BACL|nr:YtxH domain-containing protein [Cohnella endophytica]RKP45832.1 YtxH domain-containing protein [Cohnella endophytica]
MANSKGTLKGALIGGVVGATAALLLAPKSGRELRGDIKDRYSSAHERTKQLLTDAGQKTQEIAKQVGHQASNIVDKTRSAVSAAKDEAQSWKDDRISDTKAN